MCAMNDDDMFFVTPEIRARYLQRREADVAAIQEALNNGNFQLTAKLGHDWKGNGETYGFPQFSEWGKNMEIAAKNQQLDAIREIISEVTKFLSEQK